MVIRGSNNFTTFFYRYPSRTHILIERDGGFDNKKLVISTSAIPELISILRETQEVINAIIESEGK